MFTDPDSNVAQLQLLPGQKVADLGAGSGFYTLSCARAVGDTGLVYAVDVQKDLLSRIKDNAAREHMHHVHVLWGDLETIGGTHVPDQGVDAVIVSNVLFQLEDRGMFMNELKRILKPGGRVLVIDWSEKAEGLGPMKEQVFSKAQAMALFEASGFSIGRTVSAGDSHYGFIAKFE